MQRYFFFLLLFTNLSLTAELIKVNFPHPDQPEHKIEYFYDKPEGEGPFPVLFLLHGYQPPSESIGGKQMAKIGMTNCFLNMGIVPVAFSTPGFGGCEGERDFNGPYSQHALIAAIEHFKKNSFVDHKHIGAYGFSRGAGLLSMVTTQYHGLQFQILESGCYDFTTREKLLPEYLHTIWENVVNETGATREALVERSAVYHTDKIQTPALILHGKYDDRRGLSSAQNLSKHLQNAQFVFFPDATHILPRKKWATIIPFVRLQFFNLAGIGVNLIPSPPVIQIEKILPSASAPISGTLKMGDVILKISPQNDSEEIDVLRMPLLEVVKLILGTPGTKLRLYVQHFDKTYESVVLERN